MAKKRDQWGFLGLVALFGLLLWPRRPQPRWKPGEWLDGNVRVTDAQWQDGQWLYWLEFPEMLGVSHGPFTEAQVVAMIPTLGGTGGAMGFLISIT